ncbi:MAG: ABC transporter ATP-binding protein, partial [Candidatus Doudnabacteria bacterium]|nr:ABC transporter ATP-binding protein [Candidatus Doudnabacteria bacterium]
DIGLTIEFKDVSFTYQGRRSPALRNISFKLPPGEKLAVIGHNGSGKSTLVKLLAKYYQPHSGKIYVNDVDLEDIDTEWWRRQISYLVQEVPKYYMSFSENIELGDYISKPNKDSLDTAIKSAELEADVEDLPKGKETMLGKFFAGGVDLSGGQWQKLAIARSLYGQSKVLILDEPTSAIDAATEQKILHNVFTKMKSQTALIISHKFSNIKLADQIIVLEKGEIVEHGSHSDLMELAGVYSKLYKLQSEAFR